MNKARCRPEVDTEATAELPITAKRPCGRCRKAVRVGRDSYACHMCECRALVGLS